MAGSLPEPQQLLKLYDSKQHEQKQVKMQFYDLQVTASVSVSPTIPGRVASFLKLYHLQMDESLSVHENQSEERR